jgi:hypothetical protein
MGTRESEGGSAGTLVDRGIVPERAQLESCPLTGPAGEGLAPDGRTEALPRPAPSVGVPLTLQHRTFVRILSRPIRAR